MMVNPLRVQLLSVLYRILWLNLYAVKRFRSFNHSTRAQDSSEPVADDLFFKDRMIVVRELHYSSRGWSGQQRQRWYWLF